MGDQQTKRRKRRAKVRARRHQLALEEKAMSDEQMDSLAQVAMWTPGAVPALTRAAQAWGHARTTKLAADYLVAADAQEEASLHRAAAVSRRVAALLNEGGIHHDDAAADASCAYCRNATQGNHTIHRDGFGEGPEVALCDACGSQPTPTEREIWARIGQAPYCLACEDEIRSGDERRGSFHAWCV